MFFKLTQNGDSIDKADHIGDLDFSALNGHEYWEIWVGWSDGCEHRPLDKCIASVNWGPSAAYVRWVRINGVDTSARIIRRMDCIVPSVAHALEDLHRRERISWEYRLNVPCVIVQPVDG